MLLLYSVLGSLTFVRSLRLRLFAYCCEHESVLSVILGALTFVYTQLLSLTRTSTVRLLLWLPLSRAASVLCVCVMMHSPTFVRSLLLRLRLFACCCVLLGALSHLRTLSLIFNTRLPVASTVNKTSIVST